ncbi:MULTISPECIES: helix-turn-helix domain-containing protein [Nostoc]|uniref:Helix-turn-helix domain-containing protein n=1 Tax=Nostoc paludosum FACHB-159 TaxID=2692908 RepID=A0ABR8KL91_9NOSO|nr:MULTISPECIES: helix-turn-helix domain-containing protein [Nostoc]MBD2683259.1 helix-turn-helix domain-containing protein [Nostoc sp. FACHB-857]MBD2739574.1 helix-turn-helix domain-containing protein [Nostoc paludosum FACHB-159]
MTTTTQRVSPDFITLVSPFLDEYGLDPMEYRLYSHIVRRAGKDGCFESIPNMAKICLMNEKTLRKALRVLIAAGLIKIAQQRQGKTTIYKVTQSSEWVYSQQLKAIREQVNTSTKSGRGSSTKSGRGVVPNQVGVVVPNQAGVVVPNQADKVLPNEQLPIKENTLNTSHSVDVCASETKQTNPTSQQIQEQVTPDSSSSLLKKSETSHQTQNPASRSTAPALFDNPEQMNKAKKPKLQSIEDLLNQVLLDPGIMASDPLPAVYRSEIKLRGWRFPWRTATRDKIYQTCDRQLVELIAKERAKWSKCEWTEKIPTVIKSIGNLEATKGGLEELLGYWSKVVEPAASSTETSQATTDPIGYYSNRSLEWHKATFCELLDLGDKVGAPRAIAQFSTRYDQQHTGATDVWLNWLSIHHPQMYAHLYPKAA